MRLAESRSRGDVFFPGIIFCIVCALTVPSRAQQGQGTQSAPASTSSSSPASSQSTLTPGSNMNAPALPPAIDPNTMTPLYETIQEDWGSLSVESSKLEPEPALVMGDTDEQEKFSRLLVRVKWRPGDPVDLWIVLPKNVKKPPAVLYLYGHTEDTDRFRDNRWCERVTSGGVAAIGFVSALTGQRFHDRPLRQWFVSELQESVGSTVHDIKFILDYLAQRGDVDMDHIGMFGEGSGGAIAILAAAADPRIKAVDALDPWGDWPEFLAKSPVAARDPNHDRFIKPDFLKKVEPLDPVKWLPQLTVPIRVQQISQNSMVPAQCKDTIRAAAPKQAEIVRFDDLKELSRQEGHGRLFDWIKQKIQKPSESGLQSDSRRAELGHSPSSAPDVR